MGIIYIALAAFLGGLINASLGWLDSGEEFAARKFASSAIRALFGALLFAAVYAYSGTVGPVDIFAAVLGGAGFDGGLNHVAGAIAARKMKA